jgi:ribosomal protein S12 methylthiotransferase
VKTYYIESLGCAKNLVDSEVFAYILESAGYSPAEDIETAELILINSCAFLQSALAEFDQVLCTYVELKKGALKSLIVSGCVMNRAAEEFQELFPEVDAWIGLKDFDAFRTFLHQTDPGKIQRSPLQEASYAYLRISDGCQNYCSYCKIPSIRGELKSIPIEDLVQEAQALIARGVQEIILIAQDSCQYGLDIYGKRALPELIEAIHTLEGYRWLRILYLHPDHFQMEWLELYKKLPKLLPYFEIPIQHSEDRILKLMNRQKGRKELTELFQAILRELPEAVLRTTLITGFPSETEAEHQALLSFVKEIPFLALGCFCYSAEPGTPAYDMAEQIDEDLAEERQNEILNLHNSLLEARLEALVGSQIEVLVEEELDQDSEDDKITNYTGRTWFQAPDIDGQVVIRAHKLMPGEFALLEIEDVIDSDLFASDIKDR